MLLSRRVGGIMRRVDNNFDRRCAALLRLLACFLIVNTWMKFVIANRSGMSITAAFKE